MHSNYSTSYEKTHSREKVSQGEGEGGSGGGRMGRRREDGEEEGGWGGGGGGVETRVGKGRKQKGMRPIRSKWESK